MTNTTLDYAVMAMDSYSRGDRPDNPGLAEIYNQLDIAVPQDAIGVGFDAAVYNTGGEIVIAFRGTDFAGGGQLLDDALHGWLFGGGVVLALQIKAAIEFYNTVVELYPTSNITLTGHSLGGGLAGFIGSIFGEKAVLFDNEPFELAAKTLYNFAESNPGTDSEWYSRFVELRSLVYGDEEPAPIDRSKISAFAVDGEVLQYLRLLQNTPVEKIELPDHVALNAVDRHSMSLLTMLKYGEDNASNEYWEYSQKLLVESLYNINNAISVGIESTEQSAANSILMSKLAYSATQGGSAVSGDTALGLWFDDANEYGAALEAELATFGGPHRYQNAYLEELKIEIANTITKYAASAAINKSEESTSSDLVYYDDGSKVLSIDFRQRVLEKVGGVPNFEDFDGDSFLAILQDYFGRSIEPYLDQWSQDSLGGNIDYFGFGTGFGGSWQLEEKEVFSAFFGSAGADQIIGTSSNELLFTGTFGSRSIDVIDTIQAGAGEDFLIGGGQL